MNTRIKFCGLTRAEDIDAAVALGVDAIGFVLVPGSKRELGLEAATALWPRVGPFVTTVLLFRDADAAFVRESVTRLQPDLLQFHGRESDEFCRGFGRPYLFAVAMGGGEVDAAAEAAAHPRAIGVLLDSHAKGGMGGQGVSFDWSRVPRLPGRPLILAGGLNPDNVAEAVRTVRPYAVDVSSGIEASPGVKDYVKMRSFIEEVRRGERG